MGHNHSHIDTSSTRNISVAFFLNSFFVVFEIVGGLLTNSIAILSDALHDLGDCLSLGVAWYLQKKSARGRDNIYSYGYKRFSLLGSVFLSGVLTVSSMVVIVEAAKRIFSAQEVHTQGMFWMAIFGVLVNGAAALRLKKGASLNERSVYLHIMEDVLGWVAVMVVSVVMMFVDLPILDPILSLAISFWVLSNVYKNLRDTFRIMLQAVPEDVDVEGLKDRISQIPGVTDTHDLHVWSLDGQSHVMTLHIVSSENATEEIKNRIFDIAAEYGITHVTAEFENEATHCRNNCDDHG